MSSLVDVVGSDPQVLQQWRSNIVTGSQYYKLVALHTKYWGLGKKSMKDEEAEWRKSQITADRMDADDSGCYVLDIGIDIATPQKIWIREDYKCIYDELERWENLSEPEDPSPSAIISGQPGIGKSVWIYYALRRRLGEQKPVIWYYADRCYLFVDEGVFQKPGGFFAASFKQLIWTLVDTLGEAPHYLLEQGTRLYVIFTTSPNSKQWKFHKSTRFTICIMNPWTLEEMSQLVSMTNLDADKTANIYNTFGPIPRLWRDLRDEDECNRYKSSVNASIYSMTSSKLEKVVLDSQSLAMDDDVSHKLCLIRRMDAARPRSLPIIYPITHIIQSLLAICSRHMERSEIIRLYKLYMKIVTSRPVAGILFEAFGQQLLEEKITLDIVPMVLTGRPQWYSSHGFLGNPGLDMSCLGEMQHGKVHLDIRPTRVVELDATQLTIEPDIYYLPTVKINQVVIAHSIILSNGHLYVFQFTIEEYHDIKIVEMTEFLKNCSGIPAEDRWHFVFIIPTNMTVKCPQLPARFGGIRIYSAAIAVE